MKKILGAFSASLLIAGLVAGGASAAPKQQSVEGTIVLPAPFTDDTGCFSGVHRRLNAVAMGNHNGVVGYSFGVDKTTWNKPFKLDVSGGQGPYVDMDITFYLAPLTTLDDVVAAGGDPAAPPAVSVATRQAGGESGVVPKGAVDVIICMYGGQQGAGFAGDFSYLAGKGVK
jgi:hypothetical protein